MNNTRAVSITLTHIFLYTVNFNRIESRRGKRSRVLQSVCYEQNDNKYK